MELPDGELGNAETRPPWIWESSELWAVTSAFISASPDNKMIYSACFSPALPPYLNLRGKGHRVRMSESFPWPPKEIKHRQLPGKSNKVYHLVCYNAVWQVTSTKDRHMKLKYRDPDSVGGENSAHQRLHPWCDEKRGIELSFTQSWLFYWFKTDSRKLRQARRKFVFIPNPLEGICHPSERHNPSIIGRAVL